MDIHGKTVIFSVNLCMWPLKYCLGKTSPVLRVSTHIYSVSKPIGGNTFISSTKPRHVTSQIDCLGKMSTVVRVSTHIYNISKDIGGKMLILQLNLGMLLLKSIRLRKMKPCCENLNTHLWGFSGDIDGKMFIFGVNLGIWALKSIVSEIWALFWWFKHTFMGFSQGDRWENIHF